MPFERTCLCGRTTAFRDDLALAAQYCVYCGNSLERLPQEAGAIATAEPPALPDRPAAVYVVQALILIYLIASAFLWRGVLEGASRLPAVNGATAGAVVTSILWAVMFFGLRRNTRWGWALNVGVFGTLVVAGAVLAARVALFNLRGEFTPGNVSPHGSTCALLVLAGFGASFGFPLYLLWRHR
jgi:hypothetical protein